MALVSAQAFQRLAEVFIDRIAVEVKEAAYHSDHWPTQLGDLVACATNLAFAIELYLKALLTHLELPVPQHHDLRALYDAIPESVGREIELNYLACLQPHVRSRRSLSITLAKGPQGEPTWDDRTKTSPALPDLLQRSRNLFQSWRYISEFTQPQDSPYQFHKFEYVPLLCAARAMNAIINELLGGAGSVPLEGRGSRSHDP